VDVPELLARACEAVPGDVRSDAGFSPDDVRACLHRAEWDSALEILVDLPDSPWQTVAFWHLLERAAELLWMHRDAAWCRWRGREVRHGVIRAELRLVPPEAAGGRRLPIPGAGELRPMWAVGAPDTGLRIARVWVERAPEIPPGGRGVIRLAPLSPADWSHLERGALITMHEGRPVAGTATIVQVTPPREPHVQGRESP
jgi:hypothetical protein